MSRVSIDLSFKSSAFIVFPLTSFARGLAKSVPERRIVTLVQQMCVVSYFIPASFSAILSNRKWIRNPGSSPGKRGDICDQADEIHFWESDLVSVGSIAQLREGANMSNRVRRLLLFVLCVGFLTSLSLTPGFAQSDLGRISGFVKDPSGATIPNAKVSVQNKSGVSRQATTNESGYYTITNIPAGLYTVSVEAAGFQKYQSTDNKLDPSSNLV